MFSALTANSLKSLKALYVALEYLNYAFFNRDYRVRHCCQVLPGMDGSKRNNSSRLRFRRLKVGVH